MTSYDARRAKINMRLLNNAEHVLHDWLSGELHGNEFVALNPTRDDNNLGSFSVNVNTGQWNDFADDSFKGSDLVGLFARLKGIDDEDALNQLEKIRSAPVKRTPSVVRTKTPVVSSPAPEDTHLPPDIHPYLGAPSAQWEYKNDDGKIAFIIQRFETDKGKEMRPVSYNPEKDDWQYHLPQEPLPIYNEDRLTADSKSPVIVVEGEKTADAATNLFHSYVCTTSEGGSNAPMKSSWSSLYGRKATIIPDADEPGVKYAQAVAAELVVNGSDVSIIDTLEMGWGQGDDIADHTGLDETWVRENERCLADWPYFKQMDQVIVDAAARLSLFDYDRRKNDLVTLLGGVNKRSLDKLVAEARDKHCMGDQDEDESHRIFPINEPWPEPVDGKDLVEEITSIVNSHVVLSDHQSLAVTLWVLLTYVFMLFRICPRLLVSSPEKRCGKTTLLEAVLALCHRGLAAANISPAAVYRSIEAWTPTLVIDEADTFLHGNDELRGILNSGHTKSTAYVIRTSGDDHEPTRFSTYGPTAMGMIKTPPDTIHDRSIPIFLQRKLSSTPVDPLPIEAEIDYKHIRQKALRWAEDNKDKLIPDRDLTPSDIDNDRTRDNWMPLMVIAKSCGVLAEAQEASRQLSEDNSENIMEMLLSDISQIFNAEHKDKIPSKTLVNRLNKMEERPWLEYSRGREMSQATLAKLMKGFGVTTRQAKNGGKNQKHYFREDLRPVFDRYIPTVSGDTKVAEGVAAAEPKRYLATSKVTVSEEDTLPDTNDSENNLGIHSVTEGIEVAAKTKGKGFIFCKSGEGAT